ncbi:MAG: MFS transporter, partial [Marinagarivorans sp.]|nr:MFS transporter [Marinagarivorans sp.]
MTKLRAFAGAIPFFVAVFLNAFVDLGHKIIIQNTVFKLYDGPTQVILTAIVNGLILLPFIVLLSPAGFLSDKYRKTEVMRLSAWAALACTLLITLFYYLGWFIGAFAMTFLLAAQSAIYSPAKYGYLKELFGKNRLAEANGVVSALSIVAILAGIFAYSIIFEVLYKQAQDVDTAAQIMQAIAPAGFILILNAMIEVYMMYRLPKQEATGVTTPFPTARFITGRQFKDDLQPLANNRSIRLSVIGLATFWAVGQVMLAAFPAFFKAITGSDNTIAVQGILACTGLGIAIGSMIASRCSKNYIETGLLPIGALGITIGLWLMPNLTSPTAFAIDFLFIGVCGGMFTVPLNALIQFYAHERELGKTLAANNWVQNVVMLGFLILTAVFALLDWSAKSLLQLIAVVALVGCCYVVHQLPQSLMRFVLSLILMRRYKVSVQGMKNIPAKGGVLLLGNHVSWIDWAILQLASPRPVRFVMLRSIYERWYLQWFFDLFGCIPIESGPRSRKALALMSDYLNNGEVVCLFPEGTISRTGHLAQFRRGYERACETVNDDVVILPFYLRGLWGSQFSRSSSRLKQTSASILRRDLVVAFGQAVPKNITADVLKRRVFDLSVSSWEEFITTLPTLQQGWIDSAKAVGCKLSIADHSLNTELSGYKALAGSWMFARRVNKATSSGSVGILLPTSAPGVLMNMATLLAGKTVVNINYTSSIDAIKNAIAMSGIDTLFTSEKFLLKLQAKGIKIDGALDSVKIIALENIAKEISTLEKITTLGMVRLLPSFALKMLCKHQSKPSDVAAILFSSGSEGKPKGVQLTHNNIFANIKQVADVLNMEDSDAVMANLPLFHAFGLTVTQFLPLLEGCPMICHADPTDVLGCAKAIAR